jgi:iron complex outermembrane receptor protein
MLSAFATKTETPAARSLRHGCLIGVALAAIAPAAWAQQAPAEATNIDDIIVTASKRGERVSEVGASITALAGEELERLGASSFADFVGLTPGVSYQSTSPGRTQIGIRGLNVGTTQPSNTVAIYLDDTPVTPASTAALGGEINHDFDTFDMDRIEVLRGPQGTLYGASALGGVIKYVTRKPDFTDFGGALNLSAGQIDGGSEDYAASGMINAPLADWAALRVVAYDRRDGGYIDNVARGAEDVNTVRQRGGRAILALTPTENLTVTLSAMTSTLDTDGESSIDMTARTFDPAFGDLTQSRIVPEQLNYDYTLYTANIGYDLGFATLTSVTSSAQQSFNRELMGNQFSDTRAILSRRTGDFETVVQELRLTSPSAEGQGLQWLVGAYYTREEYNRATIDLIYNPSTSAITTTDFYSGVVSDYEEKALFGNATWYFNPSFDVAGGLRYSENEQQGVGVANGGGSNGQAGASSDESVTWSVTTRWRPLEGLLTYGNISTGYRAGGANFSTIGSLVPKTFEPEELTNYEVGVKYVGLDGRLDTSLSAFFIDWSSIQLPLVVNGLTFRGNNGTAESKGFEFAGSYDVFEGLTLGGTAAYIDAELTSNEPSLGAVAGERLAGSPRWSGSATVSWVRPLTDSLDVFAGAVWRYTGERTNSYRNSRNTPFRELPSYDTVDLRAGVSADGKRLTLALANAFDERGITDDYTFPRWSSEVTAGAIQRFDQVGTIRPRTISLTVSLDF